MPTIASVTPNLRPGYDWKLLELLSNRRESVPLIVVGVVDRTSKISRNKVDGALDGRVHNFRAAITRSHRQVLHGRTTNRVWSYHQSRVVAPPVVCECVMSMNHKSAGCTTDQHASHDLHFAIARHDWKYTVLGKCTVVHRCSVCCYCLWYDKFLRHSPWFYAESDYLWASRSGGSPISKLKNHI